MAHAAVGGIMNSMSGDNEDGVIYDEAGYDNGQMEDNYASNEHPCMKYWENFQVCIDQNNNNIASCQNFYDIFKRCQNNPDGMFYE